MKTCMTFCAHCGLSSLNIHDIGKYFEEKLCINTKNTFCVQFIFMAFEIIKQEEHNA
jgi:hypothetical protein